MKRILILLVFVSQFAAAKNKQPKDFPLTIHIVSVEERSAMRSVDSISTDTNGNVSGGGGGGSYNWHLMVADIDGQRYGLQVVYHAIYGFKVGHSSWLTPGDYVGRRINRTAFEIQFEDDKGKTRMETLNVISVSAIPAPVAAPAAPVAPISVPVTAPVAASAPASVPAPPVQVTPVTPDPRIKQIVTDSTVKGTVIDTGTSASIADASRKTRQAKAYATCVDQGGKLFHTDGGDGCISQDGMAHWK